MMSRYRIRNYDYQELIDECKDFSIMRLNRNIIFLNILIFMLKPIRIWVADVIVWIGIWSVFIWLGFFDISLLTAVIFITVHFIYWEYFQKKNANSLIDDIGGVDLEMSLKALKEVKQEKLNGKTRD